MRHRYEKLPFHVPVSRDVEAGGWRASDIILAMMAGLLAVLCTIEILKG